MQILLNPMIHSSANYPSHLYHNSWGQAQINVPALVPRPWLTGLVVTSCFQPADWQEVETQMQRGLAMPTCSQTEAPSWESSIHFRAAPCRRCTERQRNVLCGEGRMKQTDVEVRRQRALPDS